MAILATWIREVDEPVFARWFAERPDLEVYNARRAGDDPARHSSLPEDAAGLLLTGGPDIAIEFLKQPVPDPSVVEEPDPVRDRWEFAALAAALERRLPIFAICKGVQVLNVALGGTLHLDIPGHGLPDLRDGNLQGLRYADTAAPEGRFAFVNSSHHQSLDRLGAGLEVEAWSVPDGIVEQVRLRDYPYCVGVQYHPERHALYSPLFQEFFDRLSAGTPRASFMTTTLAAETTRPDAPPLELMLRCGCQIVYRAQMPAPIILTLKPRQGLIQQIHSERLSVEPLQGLLEYEDAYGNIIHRFKLQEGVNTIRYDSLVWVPATPEPSSGYGPALPVEELPDDLLRYTLPSRYCDSDKLLDFAFEHFGQVPHGGERVQAICDWVHHNIEYRTFSGSPNTSAFDIIAQRYGVCRDFAHTAIALCRTFNIPARYVSGYVPDLGYDDPGTPMDFHAYFEAYLGGKWYVFDARFNKPRFGRVKIAHGLDAVDGAFSTIYGAARWERFDVWSYQIDPKGSNASLDAPVDLSKRLCGTPTVVRPGR